MPVADPSNLNGDWFGRSVGLTCEPNTNKHRKTNHRERRNKRNQGALLQCTANKKAKKRKSSKEEKEVR